MAEEEEEEAEEADEDGDEEGGSVRAALCVKEPGGTPTEAKERRRDDEAGKANPAVPEERGSHEVLTKKRKLEVKRDDEAGKENPAVPGAKDTTSQRPAWAVLRGE